MKRSNSGNGIFLLRVKAPLPGFGLCGSELINFLMVSALPYLTITSLTLFNIVLSSDMALLFITADKIIQQSSGHVRFFLK